MNYKTHDCHWCGEEKYKVIVKGPDLLLNLDGDFNFVKCCNCGLLRQNPYLEWSTLKNYYPDDYASYQPQSSELSSSTKKFDKRYGLWKRVRLINKYKPNGNWIDIGAGTGRILKEASFWNKWDLMGVEPIKHAANYIKRTMGLPVFSDRLENLEGFDSSFDIVTMWDVLEHFEDPIKNLRKVREILKPGGFFIFSIPNLESWDRKVFTKYWIGYDLPRHLHLFPKSLLAKILNELGFKIIERKCVAGSHGAFFLDLVFLNRDLQSKFLNKILSKGPDFIIPRIITFIPLWILDKLKLGSNITYVVTKE